MVCIVGLPLCQQFIKECKNQTRVATVDLTLLFPKGFLRAMEGEDHKKYRNALIQGISPEIMEQNAVDHKSIVKRILKEYSDSFQSQPGGPDVFFQTLKSISSSLLIHVFFGIHPSSKEYDWLMSKYTQLGEKKFSWEINDQKKTVFEEVRDYFIEHLRDGKAVDGSSILGNMQAADLIDETSLGNLIYMLEMGRHDLSGLFRWLAKYAGEYPEHMKIIAQEQETPSENEGNHCLAFIQETLRLNQIERLSRRVESDIEFKGYFIPKGSMVRMCLWESHKDSDKFPEPFSFRPERFLDNSFSLDEYAPFGLGHHRCPIAQMSMQMSRILMNELATNYTVEPFGDGPPYRRLTHWEPAREFTVKLAPTH
jgi:cytochrome P450